MASFLWTVKCSCCGRPAIEDNYYKTGESYIICSWCGYHYTRLTEGCINGIITYKEDESPGYGVFILTEKDGGFKKFTLSSPITDEKLEVYREIFEHNSVNQEKSYLVTFDGLVFTTLLGQLPEEYFLSYEELEKQMDI